MSTILNKLNTDRHKPDPIKITNPEPWIWQVLGKSLAYDPGFRFFFGDTFSESKLIQFMEAAVKGALESGGSVFASPDRKVVLVWRWYGAELSDDRKQQMSNIFGQDGTERYIWFREATDIPIDPLKRANTMRPQYIGVLPDAQGQGYGSHILKWTLNYFDEQGYTTPFLVASTPRSAKLYGPLLGFHQYREVFLGEKGTESVIVMKRNIPYTEKE